MRKSIGPFVDRLWHQTETDRETPFEFNAGAEKAYLAIQALSPQNDFQRSLQARAIQTSTDMAQARVLLFVESDNLIPLPFLAILVFWLVIIFTSYSLFSSLNPTVFIFLSLIALSASFAIFLILELSQPFTGVLTISSTPQSDALGPLSQ